MGLARAEVPRAREALSCLVLCLCPWAAGWWLPEALGQLLLPSLLHRGLPGPTWPLDEAIMNYINKSSALAAGGVGGQGSRASGGGWSWAGATSLQPTGHRQAKSLALCRGAAWIALEELSSSLVPFQQYSTQMMDHRTEHLKPI